MTKAYAYLGPEGTFTELALLTWLDGADAQMQPYPSVPTALDAVRAGDVDGAMVALENSVEGAVPITLDELAVGAPLVIVCELVLAVSFALLVRPGTDWKDVKVVAGHPHAQPQCRKWMASHLPEAAWEAAPSNADAARGVAEGRWDAALAGAFAAPLYGLEVLADEIHDVEGAETRFVLVTQPTPPPPPTGADKTSLVLYMGDDHPGALLEILTELAVRGVNLCRIESRPTGDGIGRYCFSVDTQGHINDERVGEALRGLRRVCTEVRYLGSYPGTDPAAQQVRSGVSDRDFADADTWLAEVRRSGRSG
jgi:prephenate dehydratase